MKYQNRIHEELQSCFNFSSSDCHAIQNSLHFLCLLKR